MATLANEGCPLPWGHDVESLKGGIQRIDPLRANVQFAELIAIDH
jgi:hypothetical protein